MKNKVLVLFFVSCLCLPIQAQTTFKNYIDSINWGLTETEFISQSKEKIETKKHYYSDYFKTTTDFKVVGIKLGEFVLEGSIYVDSLSRKMREISFSLPQEAKTISAIDLSKMMDAELFNLFGQPDAQKNELDNKYVKSLDRKWYCDKYNIEVTHSIFSDSQVYSISVIGIDNTKPDFRVAKWGDSKKSVMEKEDRADVAGIDNLYVFSTTLAGMHCDVAYIFTDDKLSMAKYIFHEAHTNQNDYIKDYHSMVKLLSEKYGAPKWDEPEWRNRLYKDDPQEYGFAISLGHLSYSAGWFFDKTDIGVYLQGENYKIDFVIQYTSKKFEQLRKNQSKKRDLDFL